MIDTEVADGVAVSNTGAMGSIKVVVVNVLEGMLVTFSVLTASNTMLYVVF